MKKTQLTRTVVKFFIWASSGKPINEATFKARATVMNRKLARHFKETAHSKECQCETCAIRKEFYPEISVS